MDAESAVLRSLTLLVAVLEQASASLAELPPGRHDTLVARIDELRDLVLADLETRRS